MIVPAECRDLLRLQRTHYGPDIEAEYGVEIEATYQSLLSVLPATVARIADVGCGMAGIGVYLSRHCDELWLIDRDGVGAGPKVGFYRRGFASYHSFDAASALLDANGVSNYRCIDLNREPFPVKRFDVVISLLSWGFHFPVATYKPDCGLIVMDVRKGTDGEDTLNSWGRCEVVADSAKYRRIACTPSHVS